MHRQFAAICNRIEHARDISFGNLPCRLTADGGQHIEVQKPLILTDDPLGSLSLPVDKISLGKGCKVIGFLAKYARGMMARYIITERLDRADGLKEFKLDRYRFQPKRSTEQRFVFSRRFVPVEQSR